MIEGKLNPTVDELCCSRCCKCGSFEHPIDGYYEYDDGVELFYCSMCRPTKRALDAGDSPAQLAFSTPEHLPTAGADSTPALRQ